MITQKRPGRLPALLASCLASALFLLATSPPGSRGAADDPPGKLAPDVDRLVRWLPEDSETLIVAQAVPLGQGEIVDPTRFRWSDVGAWYGTHYQTVTDRKPLLGRPAKLIVRGVKNFSGVSKMGGYRSEGCAIIVFEAPWGDAGRELTDFLRRDAPAVRTIAHREVFAYPAPRHDSWVRPVAWEGTYFVLLDPATLLCASSDAYLAAVLGRIDAAPAPANRAFPATLPEWGHVDLGAPAWMLRRCVAAGEKFPFDGLTVSYRDDGYRVVYVPVAGTEINLAGLRKSWQVGEALCPTGTLERRPDGTVVFAIGASPTREESQWAAWFGLNLEGTNGVYVP